MKKLFNTIKTAVVNAANTVRAKVQSLTVRSFGFSRRALIGGLVAAPVVPCGVTVGVGLVNWYIRSYSVPR